MVYLRAVSRHEVMMLLELAMTYGLSGVVAVPGTGRTERLSSFLCELQPALRFGRGKQWDSKTCDEVAAAFVKESQVEHHGAKIHDLLALAEAVQESDLVATALRTETTVKGDLTGKFDGGLFGIRYPSQFTRGLKLIEVLRIPTNIRLGFEILGYYKSTVLQRTIVQRFKDAEGQPTFKVTRRPDDHAVETDHHFFQHYQNGSSLITTGWRAAYGNRVAAIYTALCTRLGEEPRELRGQKAPVAADKRTRGLVRIIENVKWAGTYLQ